VNRRRMIINRSPFTEEQIIGALQQAEGGAKVSEICRKLGTSDTTFYAWRSRYGRARRDLRELEEENERLRRLVTEQALQIQLLKEAVGGTGRLLPMPVACAPGNETTSASLDDAANTSRER